MSQNSALTDFFKTNVELVNSQLREYLKLDERCPDLLRQAMDYSLLAPGKRIRPMLALLACQACGTSNVPQAVRRSDSHSRR